MSDEQLKALWAATKEIREDVKRFNERFDDKWEAHIQNAAATDQKVTHISEQVDHLNKVLIHGNGQKAIVQQLENMRGDIENLKKIRAAEMKPLSVEEAKASAEEEAAKARKEKWKAIAAIAGVITISLPGLLAALAAVW